VANMLQCNCALVPVLDAGAQQLHLAVVAVADIAAGDELMLDYGPEYWEAKLGEWNEREMAAQLQQVRCCYCCPAA
jgi:SET domain-containing protein